MKILAVLLVAGIAVQIAGCARENAKVDVAAEIARIRATDAAWLQAAQARDVERTASFWADDAKIFPPDTPPVVGKQAIRKYVADSFATPGFAITWKTDEVVLAQAGDMAYSTGSDRFTMRDRSGKLIEVASHGAVVWKKQPDGTWKALVDIFTPASQ